MGNTSPPRQVATIAVIGALIIAVLLLASLVVGITSIDVSWWSDLSEAQIVEFVRSAGPWGIAAAVGLMVLHSFVPFPAELVAIANGMIYGPLWGIVITWTGAMLGAFVAFGLSRALGRPFVAKVLSKRGAKQLDDWVARHGSGALLFSRFLPVIAFNLINYAAGLTQVSWWTFFWTTGLGILPLTALMVIMGDQADSLSWRVWLLLLGIGLSIWMIVYFIRRRSEIDRVKARAAR